MTIGERPRITPEDQAMNEHSPRAVRIAVEAISSAAPEQVLATAVEEGGTR